MNNQQKQSNPGFRAKLQIEGTVPNELSKIMEKYAENIGGENDIIAFRIFDKISHYVEVKMMFNEVFDDKRFKRDVIATSYINGKMHQELYKTDKVSERSDMRELYTNITNYLNGLIDNNKKNLLDKTIAPLISEFEQNCLNNLPTNPNYVDEEEE